MGTNRTYDYLLKFIQAVGLSNRKFALLAGINPGSFQSMITRRGGMSQDVLKKVDSTMFRLLSQAEENNAPNIKDLEHCYVGFITAGIPGFETEDVNTLMSNLVQQSKILRSTIDESISRVLLGEYAEDANRTRLLSNFDQLNENGQKIAADRVEELTKIPDYQKKKN